MTVLQYGDVAVGDHVKVFARYSILWGGVRLRVTWADEGGVSVAHPILGLGYFEYVKVYKV